MEAKIESLRLDIDEMKLLIEKAERNKVKDVLNIGLRRMETDFMDLKNKHKPPTPDKDDSDKPPTKVIKKAYDVQIKTFSWDQSDKYVKIYLTNLKNVESLSKEDVKTDFKTSSVNVRVENLDGKNHVFNIKTTCCDINPEKSHFKIKSDMVSIFLAKVTESKKWSHLTRAEQDAVKQKEIETNKDIDDSKAVKDDPTAGLMNMMKKMYNEGDDEMKKTIAKAWTESNDKRGDFLNDPLKDL